MLKFDAPFAPAPNPSCIRGLIGACRLDDRGLKTRLQVWSFDDLVRPQQQRRWDREAERAGCLAVDHQLELGGLLDG